jgi:hypothetical protein
MEDMNMRSKVNIQTAMPKQKQSGCCCGPAADAPKSTAVEHSAKSTPAEQETAAKDVSGGQSESCCGAH